MAYDEVTAERVRVVLSRLSDVAEKQMMGMLTFTVRGTMCCGVMDGDLMIRVGKDACERMLAQRHVRPMEIAGRRTRGFVRVQPEGLAKDAELAEWVRRGMQFALEVSEKKRPARRVRDRRSRTQRR